LSDMPAIPKVAPPPPPDEEDSQVPPPLNKPRRAQAPVAEDVPVPQLTPPPSRAVSLHTPYTPHTQTQFSNVAPPPAATKGTDVDSRYVRMDSIGSGPLGTVYRAKQNALGLDVAIKELKDIFSYFSFLQRGDVLKRLKQELCAQAAVRHPSVVAVLDQNLDAPKPYFVLEACKGSLREKIDGASGKGLPVPQAMRYFLQLAYGLRTAHLAGLTHHNVKPENALFDAYGNAKLSDFGLGRVIEVEATKGMPQVFVGTGGMAYLAPEILARSKDAGAAADIYSLGIVLYEMLTGQVPGRRSPLPSEVSPDVPAKLDAIFDKMTHDKRDARYPDLDAVLEDFYAAAPNADPLGRGDLVLWSNATP
jgi:eukaryotic-like serine/threonine-protein kinase